MTDALRLVRKAFTVGVVITTIAWSIGLAAFIVPLTAHAATLTAGDLIKASLPAVYYYGADGKRYVFPNEKTYKTWYADFSTVKTVSDGELAAVSIGGNVTYRPGVKMVKIQTDPKTYAVAKGGTLRWITSEAVASALYGSMWNKEIHDVSDAFFVNYTVGTDLSSALDFDKAAQMAGSTTINQDKGLSGAAVGVGMGLGVALASDNPAASTLISDGTNNTASSQGLAPVLKLRLTASADGAVMVKTLKVKRAGISADSDLNSAHLYEGNSTMPSARLADYTSISGGVVTFHAAGGLFTVPKGGVKDVMVRVDVDEGVAQGKTMRFSIEASADVATDGAVANGLFPLTGNVHETAVVSDFARVTVNNESIPTSVDSGTLNKEVLRFNFNAVNQKVALRAVTIKMVGTAAAADIINVKLMDGGTQLGVTAGSLAADGTATFDLSASPLNVTAGQTKVLTVAADVVGGVNRTFEFTVQKETDWDITDTNYAVNLLPDDGTIAQWTVLEGASNISINAGSLVVSKSVSSPSGNVSAGTTGVELAKFDFKALGEAVKINSVYLRADVAATSWCGDGATCGLDNGKLFVDGVQIGTTTDLGEEDEVQFSLGSSFVVPANTTKTLVVKADTKNTSAVSYTSGTVTVSLRRDTTTDAWLDATAQVSLTSITKTGDVTSNPVTLSTGVVTGVKNLSLGDYSSTNPTGVAGANGVKIASFVVTAGGGEDVDLTSFVLRDSDSARPLGEDFQNLRLMRDDTGAQVGTTVGGLNTTQGNYTFTPGTAVRLTKSMQLVLNVHADALSSLTNAATAFTGVQLRSITATGVVTGNDASTATLTTDLQTTYMAASGNLTITQDAATPTGDQLTLSQTGVELARFRFQADAAEAVTVTNLVISANHRSLGGDSASNSVTGTLKNLKLYEAESGALLGSVATLAVSSNTVTPYATFANLAWAVPKNGAKTLVVKADLTPFDDGGLPSSTWRMELRENYTANEASAQADESVSARGAGSGADLTGATLDYSTSPDSDRTGNTMDVLKSKLAVAHAGDAPSGSAANGAEQTVAKFVVSNSSAGSYTSVVKLMNVDISQTGLSLTSTSGDVKIYKSSILAANLLATSDDCLAGGCLRNWVNTVMVDGNFTDVQVGAGNSMTFIVTMETNNASASANDTLTVSLGAGDITWDDDVNDTTTRDYTAVLTLPLAGKTLTY